MFNLFRKSAGNEVAVAEKVQLKGKTTNQIIEEIHESFFTEVDKLLADAKIAKSLDTDKQGLLDKCARLKSLGFTNTKEVKEAEAEITRLEKLKQENEDKKNLIEAINYFSFKYPNYKFITEDSVKKICSKYNLIYGAIDRYIGTVPDKNLRHIEEFKILDSDECFVEEDIYVSLFDGSERSYGKKYKSHEQWVREQELKMTRDYRDMMMYRSSHVRKRDMRCPLEIAAPIKDFDMKNAEVKDFKISKIEIPDPVVLKPVWFNNSKFYLIVTAWGIESSDPEVVNDRMN